MSGINTNVASLFAQNNLAKTGKSLSTAISRLSSGLRVNSAKDDAAGLAISERFRSQIIGQEVAKRNANDGISALEVAEGALGSITDSLQRMRELATQSSSGTLVQSDRDKLELEYSELLAEVTRVVSDTQFNGISLLNDGGNLNIQIGSETGNEIDIDLGTIATALNDFKSIESGTLTEASTATATLGDLGLTGTAAGAAGTFADEDLNGDGVSDLRFFSNGTNFTEFQALDANGELVGEKFNVGTPAANTNLLTLSSLGAPNISANTLADGESVNFKIGNVKVSLVSDGTNFTDYSVGAGGATVADADSAKRALDAANSFLDEISLQRATLGAGINRLDSIINNLDTNITSTSAARGRIIDADFAKETAALTRAQILQQAGTSVLAQANQLPSSVLSLLG